MQKIIRLVFLLLFAFGSSATTVSAQNKSESKTSTSSGSKESSKPAAPKVSAEQLIQSYRFTEAARTLQNEISAARSAGRSTNRLEADLARTNMGADMLRGTERVTFIDSAKVSRSQMLSALHISPESGSLVQMGGQKSLLIQQPKGLGEVGYLNQLADRIVFSCNDSTCGINTLHEAYRFGNGWGNAAPLAGLGDDGADYDYPFLMPDGVTLYFSAQGDDCLGGYDIFVTRYNADTKKYLKPENMGMPFNSPANDYLLAIDETHNLGWLVTDRNQSADTVCVYVFVPSQTREVYEMSDANRTQVLHAAKLHSIAETQTDAAVVEDAKKRLAEAIAEAQNARQSTKSRRYVINDNTVYTSLSQFRSDAARRIAEQADQVSDELAELLLQRDALQQSWAKGNRTADTKSQLTLLNQKIAQLQTQFKTLTKNMRTAESK